MIEKPAQDGIALIVEPLDRNRLPFERAAKIVEERSIDHVAMNYDRQEPV